MVTPFGVTPLWIETFLKEGASVANSICEISGKGFARCKLGETTLTIPVEGGSSVLKKKDSNPILSEHGKWRKEHLGALQAEYGRTPYYEHLIPEIENVYNSSCGITLEEFNERLLQVILSWIGEKGETNEDITKEVKSKIRKDISIFDAIFRLGKEVTLGIY